MREHPIKWYVFLIAILLFSMWIINLVPELELDPQIAQNEYTTDFFSVTYSKLQMNAEGKPHDKLDADYLEHYSENGETKLTQPIMVIFNDPAPPWRMRAQTGRISSGGDSVFLEGAVFISRQAAERVRAIDIATTNLHLEPNRNYAETDDWAELVSELDTMSGVGLKLFYQDPLYIEFLANVKGRHEYQ
jgi:lipopolysaccharide export system protein LptC